VPGRTPRATAALSDERSARADGLQRGHVRSFTGGVCVRPTTNLMGRARCVGGRTWCFPRVSAARSQGCFGRAEDGPRCESTGSIHGERATRHGKTMSARTLAGELHLPLYFVALRVLEHQVHGRDRVQTQADLRHDARLSTYTVSFVPSRLRRRAEDHDARASAAAAPRCGSDLDRG
jgi:hypothetical protein